MDQIKYLAMPKYPQFRFEYHPRSRKVYFTRITGGQEFGHIVAEDISDEWQAQKFVLVWARGFTEGNTPTINKLAREKLIIEK